MHNARMYCLSLHNNTFSLIKKLGYHPVGLGSDNFSREWLRDNTLENISYKNKYYGDVSDVYEGNDLEIKFPADADVANITPVPIKSPLMVDDLGAPNDENIKTLRSLVKPLNEVFIELPHDAIVKILDKANGSVQD